MYIINTTVAVEAPLLDVASADDDAGCHRLQTDVNSPTDYWGPFKFHHRFDGDGNVNGWEVTCTNNAHRYGKNNRSRCRCTRGWGPNGGVANTERMLIFLCLQGHRPEIVTHGDHLGVEFPEVLPSFAELDRMLARFEG